MVESCPEGPPAQLSDGKVIMPGDVITFADLCELVPLLLETMSAVPGGNGQVTPGAAVPIAGKMMPWGTQAVPTQRPGAIVGAPGGLSQQGGGSLGFGGGGGRGAAGARGPVGPAGPAGPGTILPRVKTDGNFSVVSVSPFIPIPSTDLAFTTDVAGNALFIVQAVFGGNVIAGRSNGQIGLRVDGADFPLTGNLLHTGAPGVDQFLVSAQASFPILLSKGSHTAAVIVRGDAALGAPTGSPVVVQANATIPLALTIIHQ